MSTTRLAAKAGLSRAIISFVEPELRNPKLEALLRICSVLTVDLAEILREAAAKATKAHRR
jgi:transcriptional regulator with XRE-family HTH domain